MGLSGNGRDQRQCPGEAGGLRSQEAGCPGPRLAAGDAGQLGIHALSKAGSSNVTPGGGRGPVLGGAGGGGQEAKK